MTLQKRFQVFVSSTYSDLRDVRDEVSNAILKMGHIPAGMELFGSDSDDSWSVIERTIDLSDYFVLVLAGRYGTISKTDLSFIEREYDLAVEKRIPVIAFLHENLDELPSGRVDQGKLRQMLEAFREKVKDGRQVSFWSDKKDLARMVVSDLSKQFSTNPRPGWVRGDLEIELQALRLEKAALERSIRQLLSEGGRLGGETTQQAEVDIQFGDVESETVLGSSIVVPVVVCEMPDRIPDYDGGRDELNRTLLQPALSPNKSYLRKMAEYVRVWKLCTPVRLAVENKGTSVAKDVRIEIVVPADGGREVRSAFQMPDLPSEERSFGLPEGFEPIRTHPGYVLVKKGQLSYRVEIECGNIQPGRRLWSDVFFVGSLLSADMLTVDARAFASNLSKPTTSILKIAFQTSHEKITVRDLQYGRRR